MGGSCTYLLRVKADENVAKRGYEYQVQKRSVGMFSSSSALLLCMLFSYPKCWRA
jgi:hypothetical protein